mmetsp:Transcript_30012/g.26582  ORF Transcript_30012/g.26582 Transcript_30012/m.26582 type:complete len:97 (-) Transcript_30012:141-431(-)
MKFKSIICRDKGFFWVHEVNKPRMKALNKFFKSFFSNGIKHQISFNQRENKSWIKFSLIAPGFCEKLEHISGGAIIIKKAKITKSHFRHLIESGSQ